MALCGDNAMFERLAISIDRPERGHSIADVAFAPIRSIKATYTSAGVLSHNMVIELEHGSGGIFCVLGSPLKISMS